MLQIYFSAKTLLFSGKGKSSNQNRLPLQGIKYYIGKKNSGFEFLWHFSTKFWGQREIEAACEATNYDTSVNHTLMHAMPAHHLCL